MALTRLREMQSRYELVGDVRGLGLMLGVELVHDRTTMARASGEAERVMYECLRRGLNFKVTMGNILQLTPTLTITREQLARAMDMLDESIGIVADSPA